MRTDQVGDCGANLISDASVVFKPFFFRRCIASQSRWIIKRYVSDFSVFWPDWTGFVGMGTDGDDQIKSLMKAVVHGLGFLHGDVDSDLAHHAYCMRIQAMGFQAS